MKLKKVISTTLVLGILAFISPIIPTTESSAVLVCHICGERLVRGEPHSCYNVLGRDEVSQDKHYSGRTDLWKECNRCGAEI